MISMLKAKVRYGFVIDYLIENGKTPQLVPLIKIAQIEESR